MGQGRGIVGSRGWRGAQERQEGWAGRESGLELLAEEPGMQSQAVCGAGASPALPLAPGPLCGCLASGFRGIAATPVVPPARRAHAKGQGVWGTRGKCTVGNWCRLSP